MIRRFSRLLGRLRAVAAARSGVAAVEFALILPVMVVLYLGMTQVTLGLNIDRKVTLLSRTVADLVGRDREVSTAELDDIVDAALAVLEPYDSSEVSIVLSSVYVSENTNGDLEGRVCWSYGNDSKGRSPEDLVPIPSGFDTDQTSFILAEVRLPFKPVVTIDALLDNVTLGDDTAWPVRNAVEVSLSGKTCLGA